MKQIFESKLLPTRQILDWWCSNFVVIVVTFCDKFCYFFEYFFYFFKNNRNCVDFNAVSLFSTDSISCSIYFTIFFIKIYINLFYKKMCCLSLIPSWQTCWLRETIFSVEVLNFILNCFFFFVGLPNF